MFDIISLLGLTLLICGSVASIVLYQTSISNAQRGWLMVAYVWTVWLFSIFLAHYSIGAHLQLWWWHLGYASLSLLPYMVGRVLLPVNRLGAIGNMMLLVCGAVLVLSLTFGNLFFNGAYSLGDVAYLVPGFFHYVLLLILVISFTFFIITLTRRMKDSQYSTREQKKIASESVWVVLLGVSALVTTLITYGVVQYQPLFGCAVLVPIMLACIAVPPKKHQVHLIFAISFAVLYGAILGIFLIFRGERTLDTTSLIALLGMAFFAALYHIRTLALDEVNREKGERLARYLANANARLRELDKQKTEFVSLASHQLRSPIAAIRGYTSMLLDGTYGKIPPKLKDPLVRVFRSGQHLSIVVDDFLNVTRIEQGRLAYHFQDMDLSELVKDVANDYALAAKTKSLELAVDIACPSEVRVSGDAAKLRQVFSNVLDNAVKYTEHGSVKITLHELREQNSAAVTIADSGLGIPPGEQERLFNKFIRASNANDGTVYGSGLGLYIAREIVRAHNGWIHVASPGVGKGTTFTIELPLVKEEGEKE
ncbi:MAG: HAMP domain-containing histidine kinase [Candidatus Pacebacteria bacterium]|nr:HAMP domain-containing histidine kinase [Candidatus Paceibacterota bacterium]